MKITACKPIALTAPYINPRSTPDDPDNGVRNCVWLCIETDEGVRGWGEVYAGCYATEVAIAALRRLVRCLNGLDPLDTEALLHQFRFKNRYWAMRGIGAQAMSAIEAAIWDIVGQVKGKPLWQLLGDGKPQRVVGYASAGDARFSPEQILDETKFYAAEGFRAYKMSCGGNLYSDDPDGRLKFDTERVAAAREGLGADRLLFVDTAVPQRETIWDRATAEAYIRALHPYRVRFIEEPAMTYDVKTYRALHSLNLIPTAGGESFSCPEEFEPFFDAGALGVAQPDAAVVGGPASCVRVGRRARECGASVCLHVWCAGVGIAQNLHAACSMDNILAMECPQVIHAPRTDPLRDIWRMEDGYVLPPTKPGLGVTITDEWLAKYPYVPDRERNY